MTLDDEDRALMLLNSIPRSYEHFKDAMIYGREQTISLQEVIYTVKAKELQKKLESKNESNVESLSSENRNQPKGKRGNSKKTNGKSKEPQGDKGPPKCFYCHKGGPFHKGLPREKEKGLSQGKRSCRSKCGIRRL